MIHGSADTETYYNPQEFINKGEFIKIVVRAHKLLPSSFNHFDRANNGFNYRRTPYISAAISEFPSLREVFALWPDRSMYDAVSKNDIRAVLQTINPTLFGSVDLMGKIGLSR